MTCPQRLALRIPTMVAHTDNTLGADDGVTVRALRAEGKPPAVEAR